MRPTSTKISELAQKLNCSQISIRLCHVAGLIEVRGLGIVRRTAAAPTALGVVIDLVAPDKIERLPDPASCTLLGIDLPWHRLDPFAASAAAKVRLAAEAASHAIVVAP